MINIEASGVVSWAIIGLVAGWLASEIMESERGCLAGLLLGLIGAVVGGFLFSLLGLGGAGNILGSIVVATVGAVAILAVVGRR